MAGDGGPLSSGYAQRLSILEALVMWPCDAAIHCHRSGPLVASLAYLDANWWENPHD
jgi:hypothetical protein